MTATAEAGWRKVRLGEVVKLHYGKALDRSDRDASGSVPVYGANGIKDRANRSLACGPALIVGRKGSAGEITREDGLFWALDVSYYTSHDSDRIDFNFLEHALTILDLPSMARGVKPGINRNDVYALQIPLPSLGEQKRIVAILDQAFAALDRARAHAEANLADATELFDASLREVFTASAEGKPVNALSDIAVAIVDCEHKTAPITETGYPSIRTPNVGKGLLKLEAVNRVSESTYREWSRRATPEPGDLIMAREAPAGNVAVIPEGEKVCLGQRTLLIKVDQELTDPSYLALLLLHPTVQRRLLAKSAGATVQHVNMKDIRALRLPNLPSLEKQQECARRANEIRAMATRVEAATRTKIHDLNALRQSLLQKAFSGQLT